MPITTICNETDAGAVNVTDQWRGSSDDPNFKLFVRTQFTGCVLDTYERNGYDDSDFFAIYWDEASQSVKTMEYGTTRGWTYPNHASVDATPEVIEKSLRFEIARAVPLFVRNDREAAAVPGKGKTCRVIKGRKIAKGEVVRVIGNPQTSKWNSWSAEVTTALVQIADSNVFVKTNINNLEVVDPQMYYRPEAELAAEAERAVRNTNWRSMTYVGASPRLIAALRRVA